MNTTPHSPLAESTLEAMEAAARQVRMGQASWRRQHEEDFDRLVAEVRRLKAESAKWQHRHAALLKKPGVIDALLGDTE